MKSLSTQLLTKDQLQRIISAWDKIIEIPTKQQVISFSFPDQYLNKGKVRLTNRKSTYGKFLYELKLFHGIEKTI